MKRYFNWDDTVKRINVSDTIITEYFKSGKKDIVIINIGTDKCIGDCLGPLVGSNLQGLVGDNIYVYGTLDEPIHALNIHDKLYEIYEKHKDAFIIGVDACLGNVDHIGRIEVRDQPLKPGKGVGKKLPPVGDVSIVGIVDDSENAEFFSNRLIRLSFIYKLANSIELLLNHTIDVINIMNLEEENMIKEELVNE